MKSNELILARLSSNVNTVIYLPFANVDVVREFIVRFACAPVERFRLLFTSISFAMVDAGAAISCDKSLVTFNFIDSSARSIY